ncbi:MAG TPA: divergent polysaccharide deacetylase family protein, partial [Acetobacteraceae bacterium]|nr:divergent polysaccharide deacetylase family protein [Acetobacteraceae bacterium]
MPREAEGLTRPAGLAAGSRVRPTRAGGPGRALARFWTLVIVVLGGGVALLQWLGPPAPPPPAPVRASAQPPAAPASVASAVATPVSLGHPGPIAPPDKLLLEPSAANPKELLPRIGPGGAAPMQVYAAWFNTADPRPRIGLVVAGIGESKDESERAIDLPGAVSLAFSPYAVDPEKLLSEARARGHEILISLPLEPAGYPLNNAGDEALLVGAPASQNDERLDWALSRIEGYVGATGAMDGMYGERFAAAPDLLAGLERDLAARGLLYVDPRAGLPNPKWVTGRTADVVVDSPPVGPDISANLDKLETIARERGSALG